MKKENKDFRKMIITGLGLIAGVSLTISCAVSIIILLVIYVTNLL
jgi:hypothetical protein